MRTPALLLALMGAFAPALSASTVLEQGQKPPVKAPPTTPAKVPEAPKPYEAETKEKAEVALRESFGKLYGDLVIAKARWDAAWAVGTTQSAKTALQNIAEGARDFMAVTQRRAELETKFNALPAGLLSAEDREGILQSLRSLERIARAHDDADYEYRTAPSEGGPTLEVARAAWRAQRDRLIEGMKETEARLRRPEWSKASFDEVVPAITWGVPLLNRFNAIPDLDLTVPSIGTIAPTVGTAFTNSSLQVGERITGIRHVGEADFVAVDGWPALKAYLIANADKPDRLELRLVKGTAERSVPEPAPTPPKTG